MHPLFQNVSDPLQHASTQGEQARIHREHYPRTSTWRQTWQQAINPTETKKTKDYLNLYSLRLLWIQMTIFPFISFSGKLQVQNYSLLFVQNIYCQNIWWVYHAYRFCTSLFTSCKKHLLSVWHRSLLFIWRYVTLLIKVTQIFEQFIMRTGFVLVHLLVVRFFISRDVTLLIKVT